MAAGVKSRCQTAPRAIPAALATWVSRARINILCPPNADYCDHDDCGGRPVFRIPFVEIPETKWLNNGSCRDLWIRCIPDYSPGWVGSNPLRAGRPPIPLSTPVWACIVFTMHVSMLLLREVRHPWDLGSAGVGWWPR